MLLRNVPIPEASLVGIAVGAALHRVKPLELPGSRTVQRFAGWSIAGVGSLVVARSLKAAGSTELAKPARLVTSGPYAVTRNPLYLGCALLQLGIGVAAGSSWILVMLPVVGAAVHRDVLSEERQLTEMFGDEYLQYAAKAGRYFPNR